MVGSTTPEEYDREEEQADHHDDLGAGEPEFSLAVDTYGHEIEANDDYFLSVSLAAVAAEARGIQTDEDCYPNTYVYG